MQLVHQDSIWGTFYWTFHAWWNGYRIPTDSASWTPDRSGDEEIFWQQMEKGIHRWKSLTPFFSNHGYYLYRQSGNHQTMPSCFEPLPASVNMSYPWPRRMHHMRHNDLFHFDDIHSLRIWAARDRLGREVIIRLVSFPEVESDELKVYRRLNTIEARKDPRNHTLPVLDWVKYNGLTFIVTPRWAPPVPGPKFAYAGESLHFADVLFEGLEFLHENRIAHRDIAAQNTVQNLLYGDFVAEQPPPGLRDPSVTKYAFIDFDASSIYPMDTDIESVTSERAMRIGIAYLGLPQGRSNPFKDDVLVLVRMLQTYIRPLERIIPEIGTFFEEHLSDLRNPPLASEMLRRLRKLQSSLTNDQLTHAFPKNKAWSRPKVKS